MQRNLLRALLLLVVGCASVRPYHDPAPPKAWASQSSNVAYDRNRAAAPSPQASSTSWGQGGNRDYDTRRGGKIISSK